MTKRSLEIKPELEPTREEMPGFSPMEVGVDRFALILGGKSSVWQKLNEMLTKSMSTHDSLKVTLSECLYGFLGKARMIEPLRQRIILGAPQLEADFHNLADNIYREEEVDIVSTINSRRTVGSPSIDAVPMIFVVDDGEGKSHDIMVRFSLYPDPNSPMDRIDLREDLGKL